MLCSIKNRLGHRFPSSHGIMTLAALQGMSANPVGASRPLHVCFAKPVRRNSLEPMSSVKISRLSQKAQATRTGRATHERRIDF